MDEGADTYDNQSINCLYLNYFFLLSGLIKYGVGLRSINIIINTCIDSNYYIKKNTIKPIQKNIYCSTDNNRDLMVIRMKE